MVCDFEVVRSLDLISGGSGKAVHARLQAGGSGQGGPEREHHHHHHGAGGHDHEIPKSRTQFVYDADFPRMYLYNFLVFGYL